jgi:predicted nuclease of predicted toxin-antitoxin system
MRLLLDNNLSPRLVELLGPAGWDVVHVGALGLRAASDKIVLRTAHDDARILVSADTDFGALLAASHEAGPSVVLVRRVADRRAEDLARILLVNLPPLEDDLRQGCIVVIGEDSLRIRPLPIG